METHYLYYTTKKKIKIKEIKLNFKIDDKIFIALVKTDRYYLIGRSIDDYKKLPKPRPAFIYAPR